MEKWLSLMQRYRRTTSLSLLEGNSRDPQKECRIRHMATKIVSNTVRNLPQQIHKTGLLNVVDLSVLL